MARPSTFFPVDDAGVLERVFATPCSCLEELTRKHLLSLTLGAFRQKFLVDMHQLEQVGPMF
jgi:hypothetical protein